MALIDGSTWKSKCGPASSFSHRHELLKKKNNNKTMNFDQVFIADVVISFDVGKRADFDWKRNKKQVRVNTDGQQEAALCTNAISFRCNGFFWKGLWSFFLIGPIDDNMTITRGTQQTQKKTQRKHSIGNSDALRTTGRRQISSLGRDWFKPKKNLRFFSFQNYRLLNEL